MLFRSFQRNGFTLIEMLIAMSLLGIMVVLLFASLRIASESWSNGETKMAEVNKKAVVYQFFKRHLTTIKPVPQPTDTDTQADNFGVVAFQGYPGSVRFVAAMPTASARKGLQTFLVSLDPDRTSVLKVALSPYRLDADAKPESTVLLENIETFKLSYFGGSADTGATGWNDEWHDSSELPRLIKVRIVLKDHSFWPDMIFPVKLTDQQELTVNSDTPQANEENPP